MIKILVQQVLSKLFPYKGCEMAKEPIYVDWDKCNKQMYKGQSKLWR